MFERYFRRRHHCLRCSSNLTFRYLSRRTLHKISVKVPTAGLAIQTILDVVFVGTGFLCILCFDGLVISFVATQRYRKGA